MFQNAADYERFMGRWSRLIAPAFLTFTGIPGQGRILDVGSGTGSLAFEIGKRFPQARILAIDPSEEYISYAKTNNPFPDRITFRVDDAQKLNLGNASFDSALSMLAFNFIPDPSKALLELGRVTKPGGRIAAAVWDYGDGMRMLRTFWDAAVSVDEQAQSADEKHMPLCREGELRALCKQAGLEDVREQSIEIGMRFQTFADFWEPFLLGQGPAGAFTRRLASSALETLRHNVRRRLNWFAEETPLDLPARAWAVCGLAPSS